MLDDKHVLNELDASQAGKPSIRRYHYGTKVLAVTDGAGTSYVLNDGIGSASDFWSASGTLAKSRQYDAWGNFRNGTAPTAGEAKVAYTGHQYDPETGWVYAKARYYDSGLGVFLSRDQLPRMGAEAPNLYLYALGNPLRYYDPTGYADEPAQAPTIYKQELDKLSDDDLSDLIRERFSGQNPQDGRTNPVEGEIAYLRRKGNGALVDYTCKSSQCTDSTLGWWGESARRKLGGASSSVQDRWNSNSGIGKVRLASEAVTEVKEGLVETVEMSTKSAIVQAVDAPPDAVTGNKLANAFGSAGAVLAGGVAEVALEAGQTILIGKAGDLAFASAIKWKGFAKGKLAEHFEKHVVRLGEFGDVTQKQYGDMAKEFAAAAGKFDEAKISNVLIKYDPETRRVLVANVKDREIRSFYVAEKGTADPFAEAIEEATRKVAQSGSGK